MGRYLLTGAAGFIGAAVCGLLLDEGHQVVGIDNLNDAYDRRLKRWRLKVLESREGFTFQKVDIADKEGLGNAVEGRGFDAVVNLAARAGVRPSVRDPGVYVRSNVIGALNMLDLCVQRGIGKFVLASTSSLYGLNNPRPFREDADVSKPLSPYAATKGAAEQLCHSYHYLHGLDITILRYFTVYGPAGRPDMSIFRFIQWIAEGRPLILYGDGNQERDFTYVEDIARGTVQALRPVGHEVINLGGDKPIRIMEVIGKIEAMLGKTAKIEQQPAAPADMPATWADIDKAGRLLGWEPGVDLGAGLERSVAWYLAERDWASLVDTTD